MKVPCLLKAQVNFCHPVLPRRKPLPLFPLFDSTKHSNYTRCRCQAEGQQDSKIEQAGSDEVAGNGTGRLESQALPVVSTGSTNQLLAGGAALAGITLFLITRLGSGVSFSDLQSRSVPLDTALANGKPTVVEFYAPWCEVCREMLPETVAIQDKYSGKVNYVALNVENNKWIPEMLEYNVDGIPHFEFLDSEVKEQAVAIGRLPQKVLEADVAALSEGIPLPYTRVVKQTSALESPSQRAMAGPSKQTMPKDHS